MVYTPEQLDYAAQYMPGYQDVDGVWWNYTSADQYLNDQYVPGDKMARLTAYLDTNAGKPKDIHDLYLQVANGLYQPKSVDELFSDQDQTLSQYEFSRYSPEVQAWAKANPQAFVQELLANRNPFNHDLGSVGAAGGYVDPGAATVDPATGKMDYSNAGYIEGSDDYTPLMIAGGLLAAVAAPAIAAGAAAGEGATASGVAADFGAMNAPTGGWFVGSDGLFGGTGNALADAALNSAAKSSLISTATGGDPVSGGITGAITGGAGSLLGDLFARLPATVEDASFTPVITDFPEDFGAYNVGDFANDLGSFDVPVGDLFTPGMAADYGLSNVGDFPQDFASLDTPIIDNPYDFGSYTDPATGLAPINPVVDFPEDYAAQNSGDFAEDFSAPNTGDFPEDFGAPNSGDFPEDFASTTPKGFSLTPAQWMNIAKALPGLLGGPAKPMAGSGISAGSGGLGGGSGATGSALPTMGLLSFQRPQYQSIFAAPQNPNRMYNSLLGA